MYSIYILVNVLLTVEQKVDLDVYFSFKHWKFLHARLWKHDPAAG
jgi:hypothetical protein